MKSKFKRGTAFLLTFCIVLSLFVGSAYATKRIFQDSIGHWAEDTINKLKDDGVISGFPDGLVHPDDIITRGEFATLIVRTMEIEKNKETGKITIFDDVKGHWAEKNIAILLELGIIKKDDYENNKYLPDEPITRIEMIRMLVRAMEIENYQKDSVCDSNFTDDDKLSAQDKKYLDIGKEYHIICGYPDGTVRPNDDATRAEAFEMLVKQEEAIETIEKTPDYKPSSGGSSYVPQPQYSFTLPPNTYVGTQLKVEPKAKYVKNAAWRITKDGAPVSIVSVLDGELGIDGGNITFKSNGNYKISATAENSRGQKITYEQSITVYPVITLDLKLAKNAHTDTMVAIDLKTENLGANQVLWTINHDGKEVPMQDAITGELKNNGGSVIFKNKGIYEVIATVADELGKVVIVKNSILIYPVPEIKLELQSITHTDKAIALKATMTNADESALVWSLTRNGEAVKMSDFIEGEIKVGQSNLRFKEKGVYNLTAKTTDKAGRAFEETVAVCVYPVGSAGFYLPQILHTDKTVKVETTFNEIGNQTAKWALVKNGKQVSIGEFTDGSLNNSGGDIRFTKKGDYALKVSFSDEAGRTYSYEQKISVYPVPTVKFEVPKFAHTDKTVDIDVKSTDTENVKIQWLLDNTYGFAHWDTYVSGNLNNSGGAITFKRAGVYEIVARITDETGRVFLFENNPKIEVLPVLNINFDMPKVAYTDTQIDIRTGGNNNALPIEWSVLKDGKLVEFSEIAVGKLNEFGGEIRFKNYGEYEIKASMTDLLNRTYSHTQNIRIMPVIEYEFNMPQTVHVGSEFDVMKTISNNLSENTVVWGLTKDGKQAEYVGNLTNNGGKISICDIGKFTLESVVTDSLGRTVRYSKDIMVTNSAPNKPTLHVEPTRTQKDGKFHVTINGTATDPDGDYVEIEYEGVTADNYYAVGTHTVKARAKDIAGAYSEWVERIFSIENSAPTRPVITRNPSGNSVAPRAPVTITASSTDSDGDAITYVWEGRPTETAQYPLGKNTVRVKAVDITGTESPWSAIVFFVADSNGSGGMTLEGPDSTILENGIEGATITGYTFTVPPVSGHSGSDYGRVRGYNNLTKQWDQLDYGTTTNGITFERAIGAGVYSKLEFYYYTNHNCMYVRP